MWRGQIMSYKVVFIDIDGTLVNEEKQIPNDALEAIEDLQKKGIEVVLATGRAPYFFTHIREKLNINSYLCFNGSLVVHKGEIIYDKAISKDTLEKLETLALEHNHPIVFQGRKKYRSKHNQHPHVLESFASLKVEVPLYHEQYWKEEEIYQSLLYCQEHEEDLYHESFSDIHFVRWHRLAMDVIPKGGSKATGIKVMLDHIGLSTSEAVAFGDGLNDKEMLSFVGMGIAMGNAHEEVKPFAKYVTKSVDQGGLKNGLIQIGLLD